MKNSTEKSYIMLAAERLQRARIASGKSPDQIAKRLGITRASYQDLEYNTDIWDNISIKQIISLCEIIDITPRQLFFPDKSTDDISIGVLVSRLFSLQEKYADISELEEQVGWELGEILAEPEREINKWNLACLMGVCKAAAIDWAALLQNIWNNSRGQSDRVKS